MKLFPLTLALLLAGCGQPKQEEPAATPRTAITVTHAVSGSIANEIVLSAVTAYQNKSVITAPIPAFITASHVQPGTVVRKGTLLYTLESKERQALGGSGSMGVVPLKASSAGIVLSVLQQPGSYVPEGTTLCTLADLKSLVFELNVPYEQHKYAVAGKHCTLVLPDDTRLNAVMQTSLATMNTVSQVQPMVARAQAPFLPEGMTVKVLIDGGGSDAGKLILPKAAVQSNETLTAWWVMKLANDSTAVKVPVAVGNSDTQRIEVISSQLSPSDRIVLTGSYGLEDHALVTLSKE